MEFLKNNSVGIDCTKVIYDIPHRGVIPFLEAALTAAMPLITENTGHFPAKKTKGSAVLTLAEFLDEYAAI